MCMANALQGDPGKDSSSIPIYVDGKDIEGGIIRMEFTVEGQKEGPIMRIVLGDGREFCFTAGFCPVREPGPKIG